MTSGRRRFAVEPAAPVPASIATGQADAAGPTCATSGVVNGVDVVMGTDAASVVVTEVDVAMATGAASVAVAGVDVAVRASATSGVVTDVDVAARACATSGGVDAAVRVCAALVAGGRAAGVTAACKDLLEANVGCAAAAMAAPGSAAPVVADRRRVSLAEGAADAEALVAGEPVATGRIGTARMWIVPVAVERTAMAVAGVAQIVFAAAGPTLAAQMAVDRTSAVAVDAALAPKPRSGMTITRMASVSKRQTLDR